jgi:hypothetical protein
VAHPFHHSVSSTRKWGGKPSEYRPIHTWFDESKRSYADFRHRALRHHAEGIFECERVFGETLTLSTGRKIPVRWVAEQHVQEDLGFIPTLADWLRQIDPLPWMSRGAPPEIKALELETEEPDAESTEPDQSS